MRYKRPGELPETGIPGTGTIGMVTLGPQKISWRSCLCRRSTSRTQFVPSQTSPYPTALTYSFRRNTFNLPGLDVTLVCQRWTLNSSGLLLVIIRCPLKCDPDLCNCHHVPFLGVSSLLDSPQFLLKAVRPSTVFLFLICSSHRLAFWVINTQSTKYTAATYMKKLNKKNYRMYSLFPEMQEKTYKQTRFL